MNRHETGSRTEVGDVAADGRSPACARLQGLDVLQVEGLAHRVDGRQLFADVSFRLGLGMFASLLGPSGCGKTTLLRLIAGLEPLQQGRISLGGQPVADAESGVFLPPEARRVGMVFQDFALFPHLTVRQNILFGLRGRSGRDCRARLAWVEEMLERFGLAHRADAWPANLSGGEQQRVALLRALAPQPALLLLDEPFSSLDVARRLEMREEMLEIIRMSGTTALMVTHDAQEALFMSDLVMIMGHGGIVQAGTPTEVYEQPVDPFVMSLFGHMNVFAGRVDAEGRLPTPIGALPVPPSLQPGQRAEAHVRASAFLPVDASPEEGQGALVETAAMATAALAQGVPPGVFPWQVRGRVLSAHFMGGSSHLHVAPEEAPDQVLHMQAPGRFLPRSGATCSFWLRRNGVFIFPAGD